MKVLRTEIADVLRTFAEVAGIDVEFVQDNHSRSMKNVLRGLHYQIGRPQGKLLCVSFGQVWDVAVDLRKSSKTFGKWAGFSLTGGSKQIAWIPPGCAHGFVVTSDVADVQYKTTDYYSPKDERVLLWNDPDLAIKWPVANPVLNERDRRGTPLRQAEVFP